MPNVNKDQRLYDAMILLKRHLRSCKECASARKSADESRLCIPGARLTLRAADRYDHLIALRTKAFANRDGTVFPCPDLSKHGKSYELTAVPLHVTGIQDGLW